MKAVRLDRLLANLGYGSRSEARALLARGAVSVDGVEARRADFSLDVAPDLPSRVTVAGERLDPPHPLTIIMHKPAGLVCSHAESGRSVYDLLPARWRRRRPPLSTIGRLDADATGLLLITDDGALSHRITAPRGHLTKLYHVSLAEPVAEGAIETFASGCLRLDGDDKPLRPATLRTLSPLLAELVISEGRYHQVKRMFAAVGNRVLALHRARIGGLVLPPDVGEGSFRVLTADELSAITAKANPDLLVARSR